MAVKKKKIIYVASMAYVNNDSFLPIVLTLAYRGADIKIVFPTVFSMAALQASSSWWNWILKFGIKNRCLELTGKRRLINKLGTYFRKLLFVLTAIADNADIVFVPIRDSSNRMFQLLTLFCNVRYYIGGGALAKDERQKLVGKNLTPEQRVAMGKPAIPKKKKNKVTHVKNIIGLSDEQLKYEDEYTWENSLIIPLPHMQQWWHDFVKSNPHRYGKKEIDAAKEIITVIMLRKGNYYFRKDSDVDVLLDEIITVIRRYYPKTLIVLKPKFEWLKYWIDEEGVKKRYNDNNIVMSYDSLITLSTKTVFAVSTCQSSACYYMLANGVPVIEYGRYSDIWKKIFPQVTSIEDYGGIFTETIETLDSRIKTISQHKNDLEFFKRKIGYRDMPISIDMFEHGTDFKPKGNKK